jgi:hypothetical protein
MYVTQAVLYDDQLIMKEIILLHNILHHENFHNIT